MGLKVTVVMMGTQVFLDRYEVLEEIGRGGMATVYRGRDRLLDRPVAIKVLHPHLAWRPEARSRFGREARVIARLKHPNIVEVYDFSGEDSEEAFIVQEFVSGETLLAFLERQGPLPPEVAALLVSILAKVLDYAHSQGVIHRDIKPENVMIRSDGVLKLMDFGIAHVVDMEHLTVTGAIVGSPAHMSPEQVDGRGLDGRTDIFSLGTLFYQAASGTLPFTSDTPAGLLRAIAEVRMTDIRAVVPGFPDDLLSILLKMMAKRPEDRYERGNDVARDIEEVTRELGLGPDYEEFARFYERPAERALEVRKTVARARLERAKRLVAMGRYPEAIRELNTVLAYEPEEAEARETLEKVRSALRRRQLSKRWLFVLLLSLVVIALFVLALELRWFREEERIPQEVVLPLAPRDEVLVPSIRRPAYVFPEKRHAEAPPKKIEREQVRPPQGKEKVETVPVIIYANPPAAKVEIDGKFFGYGSTGEIFLGPGRHIVRLSHERCKVCRDTEYELVLDPKHPPKAPLRFSIGYLDAYLLVEGEGDGKVFVNGLERGTIGQKIRIPMDRPSETEVLVEVRSQGGVVMREKVVLSPGQTRAMKVAERKGSGETR